MCKKCQDCYSKENIRRLCDASLRRYGSYLVRALSGATGYNAEECADYLRIWSSVESHGYEYSKLSKAGKREVDDAIFDEHCEEE